MNEKVRNKITSDVFVKPEPEFIPVEMDFYSPTRMDYLSVRILSGLISGRSEKDIRSCVNRAVKLAQELIDASDNSTQD